MENLEIPGNFKRLGKVMETLHCSKLFYGLDVVFYECHM